MPKAAGWWRVMFSPRASKGPGTGTGSATSDDAGATATRHALDFRVLTGSRIVMFDASASLFRNAQQQPQLQLQQQDAQSGSGSGSVGFRPIPELGRAIADGVAAGRGRGTVAGIEIGVVCGAADVVAVGEALWTSIARACRLGRDDRVVVKMEVAD
jgi:hypothetical protein